jgi:hypothetical protein
MVLACGDSEGEAMAGIEVKSNSATRMPFDQ